MSHLAALRWMVPGILITVAVGAPLGSWIVNRPPARQALPAVLTVPEVLILGEVPIPTVTLESLPIERRRHVWWRWWSPPRPSPKPPRPALVPPCSVRELAQGTGSVRACGVRK